MLRICLVFWESEPQYAYKCYAYKKNMYTSVFSSQVPNNQKDEIRSSFKISSILLLIMYLLNNNSNRYFMKSAKNNKLGKVDISERREALGQTCLAVSIALSWDKALGLKMFIQLMVTLVEFRFVEACQNFNKLARAEISQAVQPSLL